MALPIRVAGVAQVAGINQVTLRRKAGSQESSQSQLKGLLSTHLQMENNIKKTPWQLVVMENERPNKPIKL